MLAAGASLLAAAALGAPLQPAKAGGTLRVVGTSDLDSIDPALAYGGRAWQLEFATGLLLLNHRDAGLQRGWEIVPEAARFPRVSRDGRVYTFELRRGFRFSDGYPVTAASFAYALNRALHARLGSVGAVLLSEAGVLGAQAVIAGKAKRAKGIRARGRTLVIRLKRPNPRFVWTLVLPLFQAVPLDLPPNREVVTPGRRGLPSAGPYYVADRKPEVGLTLRRNPFYRGSRPHRPAAIRFSVVEDEAEAYRLVEDGAADYTVDLPAEAHAEAGSSYGTRNGRYRVNPAACLLFLALRTDTAVFNDNQSLRQAVNFAVDRTEMAEVYTSAYGAYAVSPTDQYITPGFPGFRDENIYPLDKPDLPRARLLAQDHLDVSTARYSAPRTSPASELWSVVHDSLAEIGLDVEQSPLRRRRPLPGDIYPLASCAFTPDPGSFLQDVFILGAPQAVQRRIAQAHRLRPRARLQALGRLDAELARGRAPAVAWGSVNSRELFSSRVDPRTIVYQPFFGGVDLAALALR